MVTDRVNIAFASRSNIESASYGSRDMPTTWRSQIFTDRDETESNHGQEPTDGATSARR
jgi:hypothetical protein